MNCFKPSRLEDLKKKPLEQIWRDHLLAGSLLSMGDFKDGAFVFLSPKANPDCEKAVALYRDTLDCENTFLHWTVEELVEEIRGETDASWVVKFHDRYLAFHKIDRFEM